MTIVAIALTLSIEVNFDLTKLSWMHRSVGRPAACGISVVGYRISGTPGQRFRYAGEMFDIPDEGFIELIAEPRHTTYRIEGRKFSLQGPLNAFGFMEIQLVPSDPKRERR